jgi:arylsulfatase A-like enzyme
MSNQSIQRPNILYLHCHDAGRYIEPFGHAIPSPNLQKLAEGGVLFRNNFCASPSCSASRAALLTGQSPHNASMLGLAHIGWSLYDYRQHLAYFLRHNGYHTAVCGVEHTGEYRAKDAGGNSFLYHEKIALAEIDHPVSHERHDRGVAQASAQWLRERGDDAPFFLAVGFVYPHRVYGEADPSKSRAEDARYITPPAPLPDTPETRADMADFKASVRVMDEGCGVVLDALEKAGLADNTLVIATTDHGIAFPYMKCNLTDHGCGVYLMLRGPGVDSGKVVDAMTTHIDVYPTLCEMLDLEKPEWLQGESLVPLLDGTAKEIHDELFFEVTFHASYEPMRAVRTKRHKLIKRFDPLFAGPVLPNCDAGQSKKLWVQNGWADREPAMTQLYDLVFDPNETNNLAESAIHADIRADLEMRLMDWMRRTNDPLLKGAVPLNESATVWPADAVNLESLAKGRELYLKPRN